jgi:hypothetical protein
MKHYDTTITDGHHVTPVRIPDTAAWQALVADHVVSLPP